MPRMQAITRDVILRAVFGTRAGAREDDLRARIDDVLRRTTRARTQLAVIGAEAAGLPRSVASAAGSLGPAASVVPATGHTGPAAPE